MSTDPNGREQPTHDLGIREADCGCCKVVDSVSLDALITENKRLWKERHGVGQASAEVKARALAVAREEVRLQATRDAEELAAARESLARVGSVISRVNGPVVSVSAIQEALGESR